MKGSRRFVRQSVRVLLAGFVLATVPAAATPAGGVLEGSYAYGWMGADVGFACGAYSPAVLTRVRIGTVTFGADGRFALELEERVTCPGGAFEDSALSLRGLYTLEGDELALDLGGALPGPTQWTFRMNWDRAIGFKTMSVDADGGYPGLGVLVRHGTNVDENSVLGGFTIARMRQSQLPEGIEARGMFGTLTFEPGGQYTQVVDQRTVSPNGSDLQTGMVKTGTWTVAPDGSLSIDGGTHIGAVTPDGGFGFLLRRAPFGSMFAVFARDPVAEPTFWALDDMWSLGLYGVRRNEQLPFLLKPDAEVGFLDFDAHSGQVLVGHTEVWAEEPFGGANNGFSMGEFARVGSGVYALLPGDGASVPLHLGRFEDVLIFADLSSPDDVWVGAAPRAWGPLTGDTHAMSPTAGNQQTLTLRAGVAHAGQQYLILGSLSGTFPGMWLGDHYVPLNEDAYTLRTLTAPDPPLSNASGVLSPLGRATATFTMPPEAGLDLAGRTVYHAFLVMDPAAPRTVLLTSNPVPLVIGY